MTSAKVDAVVVGSGPNGLSAAIALAQGGRSVLVLEAQDRLGGAVATEELTLPGFHHDVFSAVYPAGAASPVFAKLPLERHGLRWVPPGGPDGPSAGRRPRDRAHARPRRDRREPRRRPPRRRRRVARLAGPYVEHYEALRATMLSGFPPVTGPARLLAGAQASGTLDFVQILLSSARALGERLFDGPRRARLALRLGDARRRPPDNAGSAISGVVPPDPRPRGRLAEPGGRRGAARRRARRRAARGGRRGEDGHARGRVLTARSRVAGVRTDDGDVVAGEDRRLRHHAPRAAGPRAGRPARRLRPPARRVPLRARRR